MAQGQALIINFTVVGCPYRLSGNQLHDLALCRPVGPGDQEPLPVAGGEQGTDEGIGALQVGHAEGVFGSIRGRSLISD